MTVATTKHVWRSTQASGGDGWHGRFRVSRISFGFHVYRHRYALNSPDRWVFQPWLTYDRRTT